MMAPDEFDALFAPDADPPPTRSGHWKVLVVDDEPGIHADALADHLRNIGTERAGALIGDDAATLAPLASSIGPYSVPQTGALALKRFCTAGLVRPAL